MSIKSEINSQIKESFYSKYAMHIDPKLLNVTHIASGDVDYSLKSLVGVSKIVNETVQDTFNGLCSCIDEEKYIVSLERNCLNIKLHPEFVQHKMKENKKMRILVDFSSPNIAKDMHVGHLRSTIIGDSICKLFEQDGHDVLRVNHIGDFGLQFGMIIEHLLQKNINYNEVDLSIADLQTFYAESKKRFDTEDDFKAKAYHNVILLQSGDVNIVKAWNFIKDISRKSYNDIYSKLNVNLTECGESFYQNKIPSLIEELQTSNILVNDNGWIKIPIEGYEVPLTVVKSDGGFTYDTTDLAAVKYRLQELNADKIIYVVDNGQAGHFDMIFKVAEMMGWKRPDQELKHVGFGLVLGESKNPVTGKMEWKKLKSRSGDTVKLKELLDDALVRAREMLESQIKLRRTQKENSILKAIDDETTLLLEQGVVEIEDLMRSKKECLLEKMEQKLIEQSLTEEEKDKIVKCVAYGSIKYADLASVRTGDYKYSEQKMLSLKGNTGAFQLYEYVRICAILRKVENYIWTPQIDCTDTTSIEDEEINVCKQILFLPEVLESVKEDLMLHKVCAYLYNLTNAFSVFHKKCRCLNYNSDGKLIGINRRRLDICKSTKRVLEQCFDILGIETIDKM